MFIGFAIAFALLDVAGSYLKNIPFLATCAIIGAIAHYAGDRLGWMIENFAEYKERKSC